jgi:hypothetical protein
MYTLLRGKGVGVEEAQPGQEEQPSRREGSTE